MSSNNKFQNAAEWHKSVSSFWVEQVKTGAAKSSNSQLRSRFHRNTSGNVALIFGFALLPVTLCAGAAVDYGRAHTAHNALQQSADAAALAAAVAQNISSSEREQVAVTTFAANAGGRPLTAAATATATVTPTSAIVTSQFEMPTTLMKVLGIPSILIGVSSTVSFTGKKIELALMTDITGSMNETRNGMAKIDGLKLAAQELLDIILPDNMPPDTARVSLVPFSNYVNAGSYAPLVTGLSATSSVNGSTVNLITCVTERTGTQAYTDADPTTLSPVGPFNQNHTSDANYSADGACLRDYNGSSLPLPAVMPLTTDKAALMATINSYQAGGSTAGHLGTAWAWYTISPNWNSVWPTASQPVAYTNTDYMKAVVLMTDGEYNTQYSYSDSKTQALALCASMKAAGVVVYTVGFGFDPNSGSDNVARDTLTQCSSGSGHYYFPFDATALQQTFVTIGQNLSNRAGRGRLSQ